MFDEVARVTAFAENGEHRLNAGEHANVHHGGTHAVCNAEIGAVDRLRLRSSTTVMRDPLRYLKARDQ